MTIYLGPVGALQSLPSVGRGFAANVALGTAAHEIAGGRGGRVVDRVGAPLRTWTMGRAFLTLDEIGVLEGLALGGYGAGPFVLLDPWQRNLLSPNQSSGTDVLDDTTGFVAVTGSVSSSTAQADAGQRSLAWAVTAANQRVMTGATAATTTALPATDIPVLPSTAYIARARGRLSASTGTVRLDVFWYKADGTAASTASNSGSTQALATGSFTSFTVSATSPADAALARLSVINTVMGAAQTIYLDAWQAQQAAALDAWTVGLGVPRVCFTEQLGRTYRVLPYVDADFTLTEV